MSSSSFSTSSSASRRPRGSSSTVNFAPPPSSAEGHRRGHGEGHSVLTAKFDKGQMALIRKRIQVEEWIIDRIGQISQAANKPDAAEPDLDIDEIMDKENDAEKIDYVLDSLSPLGLPDNLLRDFTLELLTKLSTL